MEIDFENLKGGRYTELFTEYISNFGGADSALPTLFDYVPDRITPKTSTLDEIKTTFKDAFILNFANREIGFETEDLFALKLEGRAQAILPYYIVKLKQLEKFAVDKIKYTVSTTTSEESTRTPNLTTETEQTSVNESGAHTDTTTKNDYPDNGETSETNVSGSEKRDYGKATDTGTNQASQTTKGTDKTTHTTTNSQEIEMSPEAVLNMYNKLAEIQLNLWTEIFKKFDSLFLAVL